MFAQRLSEGQAAGAGSRLPLHRRYIAVTPLIPRDASLAIHLTTREGDLMEPLFSSRETPRRQRHSRPASDAGVAQRRAAPSHLRFG